MAAKTKAELAQDKLDAVMEQVYNLEIDERYLQRAVLKQDAGDAKEKLAATQKALKERRLMASTLEDIIQDEKEPKPSKEKQPA